MISWSKTTVLSGVGVGVDVGVGVGEGEGVSVGVGVAVGVEVGEGVGVSVGVGVGSDPTSVGVGVDSDPASSGSVAVGSASDPHPATTLRDAAPSVARNCLRPFDSVEGISRCLHSSESSTITRHLAASNKKPDANTWGRSRYSECNSGRRQPGVVERSGSAVGVEALDPVGVECREVECRHVEVGVHPFGECR